MNTRFLLTAVGILLYLFLYYAVGSLVVRLVPAADFSIARTFLLGFFGYFFLFALIALPMKVLLLPLSMLAYVWAAVLVLIVIIFIILERRHPLKQQDIWKTAFLGERRYLSLVFLGLLIFQLVFVNLNGKAPDAWNQAYYLGDVSTSLYTNTISQYDPFTGKILEYLNPEYLLETYHNHGSVMCYLLGLHPMVERLTVMASVVTILYQFVVLEIARFLFGAEKQHRILIFVGFMALLNLFSSNEYTGAGYLMFRPSEGKTILVALILPTILCFFMETIKDTSRNCWWIYSFLTILGSFGLNMGSIFMIPFEITALYIPLALHKRKMSVFGRFLLLLLPCIVIIILYVLTKTEFLIYIN